ncbi:hypothetical protein SCLCIDRAFT_1209723 [Scleroderma citrinum Foug A]|uniref:Major facilitator superfamily (MFS) profile domain-containing protein n=1 Tax=Scleroderma citrinum Foug A TaxID=1036808 RepID=A0A0C3A3Q7_9AGAM|nr:hypothetical protein SCLCIDRAFT_1209723 [Scleroderma citrinum Foug A]
MDGIGGKPAWAWIFILEGLITVVAGAVSPWIIVDFPENASFLTEAERTVVIRRLQCDDQFSAAGERLKFKHIKKSFTEWKTYAGMLVVGAITVPVYSLALFLPSIIHEATPANLLTIPVYMAACIFTLIVGVLGDRYRRRGLFNLICLPVCATGFIILLASRDAKLSYFAYRSWVANNVEGSSKRSVTLAISITSGNVQGIVSSNIYRANQTPWYPIGHGIALMYVILAIIGTVILWYILKRENARRDRGERDEIIQGQEGGHIANGCFESVEEAKREKGDEWSGYRHTL